MEISVPDLGDFADVEIIEVMVKVGDRIEAEDPLVSLETDKATMDVPSPAAGSVVEVKVAVGDRVSTGDVIVVLGNGEAGGDPQTAGSSTETGTGGGAATAGGGTETAGGEAETGGDAGNESEAVSGSFAGGASRGSSAPTPDADDADSATPRQARAVHVPDLGDFDEVEIIDVLVEAGEVVEAEQGLITLETDKATMDVPAPEAGTIVSLRVKVGDRVSAGDEILQLAPQGDTTTLRAGAAPSASASAEPAPPAGSPPSAARGAQRGAAESRAASTTTSRGVERTPVDEKAFSRAHASPSVRKLARELGVDLGRVRGTGRKGRVTGDDVKRFVKEQLREGGAGRSGLPTLPSVDFSKFGEIERRSLSRIQRISSARLHASWVNIPHVTQHDEADITALEDMRQSLKDAARERGIRLTPLAFVLRACVLTLEEFPHFKASLDPDGETLILKRYTHLGFAADTPNGLVVPVIRDADRKDVYELASSLATLSERARDGQLKSDDMQGGVFTVSSLGGIGGTFFTPIINAPEVAILGVSRSQQRPVWQGDRFVPRLMLPLSLSYDHRVIDGADAVRFTTRLAEVLGQVERLLEAIP